LRAAFCNECGRKLNPEAHQRGEEGPLRLYADVAHPINAACRELIQARVLDAFDEELQRAQRPDYVSTYDDDYDDDFLDDLDLAEDELSEQPSPARANADDQRDPQPQPRRPRVEPRQAEPPKPAMAEQSAQRQGAAPPRGPHKKPQTKTADADQGRAAWRKPPTEEFGAGIF
jgi:stage V sporulation protein G